MTGADRPVDVLVLTRTDDFHAFAVTDALARRGFRSGIVETDRLAGTGGVTWASDGRPGTLRDVYGGDVVVRDAAVVWWRRLTGEPQLPDGVDPAAADFVARECRASLLGLVETEFAGRFISNPDATRAASNKLVQLRVAARAGFRVPRTLISSNLEVVRDFCESLDWRVVAKTVGGAGPRQPVMTGRMHPQLLAPSAVSLCPAIYQELIEGEEHLRVNAFGNHVYAARLTTDRLDWRYPLDCDVEECELDDVTSDRLLAVLDLLGLRMGVFDLKVAADGEPVWLEVNPQGQFLWVEGMCGMPLGEYFADFLSDEVAAERSGGLGSAAAAREGAGRRP